MINITDEIIDKFKEKIQEALPGCHITTTYDYKTSVLHLRIIYHLIEVYNNNILINEINNFETICAEILVILDKYYKLLISEGHSIKSELLDIKQSVIESKFINHGYSKCAYPNLGHARYCYMWLVPNTNAHIQWAKVYFDPVRKKINYEKTTTETTRYSRRAGDEPPHVPYVIDVLIPKLIEYIKENEKLIIEETSRLPLNKSQVREDASIAAAVCVLDNEAQHTEISMPSNQPLSSPKGDIFRLAKDTELNDPNRALYITIISRTNRGAYYKGLAKRIGSDEQPIVLVDHGYVTGFDWARSDDYKPAIITDNQNIYLTGKVFIKTGVLPKLDQYYEILLKEALEKYSAR